MGLVSLLEGEEAKKLPVLFGLICSLTWLGCIFEYPWFIPPGWGLSKRVFASPNARRDWWRSHSAQTGAGNALLPLKKLFHAALLQMSPLFPEVRSYGKLWCFISSSMKWELLLILQRQLLWWGKMPQAVTSSTLLVCFPLPCHLPVPHSICPTACVCPFSFLDSECY